jgi:RNA polymerase sigma-54 factor
MVKSIVRFQRDYFDKGDKYLRTLTLKQVAEDVGIHESTVSRSINGKYMQCPRGVLELKFFFSAGVSDWQGEGVSSNSIKTHLREIIEAEDHKSPYSDQDLVEILKERGFDISRRTIAKYRDEMRILSSSRRKRF